MVPDHDHLREIKTFPSLVKYLRDELDWPIEADDFEDLTFDYEPEELGIDVKTAAKIEQIKQLRPLVTHQPWGIFFVKFEPKRLPVMALRRILSRLVIKKRTTAKKSDQPTWHMHDLLFISNYGEGEQRQITFAHFSQDEIMGDLPTLKVLGWDDADTALHIDHTHRELREKLHWREDDEKISDWRSRWSSLFILRHREVITTSKALSERLARLASDIRKRVNTILRMETDKGPLRKLQNDFKTALIHDLSDDDFADMYAQTITYGLLTARVSRQSGALVQENITDMVPVTNPFLRDLLGTFLTVGGRKGKIDFDEVGINDVVQTLREANMEAVLRDFGDRKPEEDPVIFFYEDFLKAYDKKKKVQRGVFYTPKPVVSYIVRSVHELLQKEFELEDGLADTTTWGEMVKKFPYPEDGKPGLQIPSDTSPETPFVQILDPATGTGTFLVEVIEVIFRTLTDKWKKKDLTKEQQRTAWNNYVPKHLLPRLHGYELMMAPYAIAHMKIGLKLYETGYRFDSNERARIYLTNALEPPQDFSEQFVFMSPALAHEAQAVNTIKRDKRFTVIIGNPPYAGHSSNTGEWISKLVHDYHFVDGVPLGERNPKWLQDDYVKFVRLGQQVVSQSPMGILGFITNHSYSDNPTFRGMRRSLMNTFHELRVLDLHGNSKRKEKNPDGGYDENVFDIQQGVSILLAWRLTRASCRDSIFHANLWGSRAEKYSRLAGANGISPIFEQLSPTSPFFLFIPQNKNLQSEFEPFPIITEVFPVNNMGVTTGDDDRYVGFTSMELFERFKNRSKVRRFTYRPFDQRTLYYDSNLLARSRTDFMRHLIDSNNIALVTVRRPRNDKVANFFVCKGLTDKCFISSLDNCQLLPLYILPKVGEFSFSKEATPNIALIFLERLASALGLKQDGHYGLPQNFTPEDIFFYAYAVFHSPSYRSRYSEFLKIDFPRLPLTGNLKLFQSLSRLGGELAALHLMESPKLNNHISKWQGKTPTGEIEKVTYSDEAVWIDKTMSEGFRNVPENVWNFHIGGYQVCQKWLKDRKGRQLSEDDIEHYHRIVVALNETIRLMAKIDDIINAHGGWPAAFQTEKYESEPFEYLKAAEDQTEFCEK
jgi:hypothetical protein